MQPIDYLVLVAYFAVMIGIGLWAMRRVSDQEDYFMGGRGFGKLLQTFAAFGAGTGAHEPVQVGRTAWTSGLSGVWSALMWLFVTPIYWITAVWYRRMRHLTLGDWFVERYESTGDGCCLHGVRNRLLHVLSVDDVLGDRQVCGTVNGRSTQDCSVTSCGTR